MSNPVQAQYDAYPYPPRNPADEAKRLIEGYPSHLLEINHYIYGGRRDFTRRFRVLVAGGGTGDGTIMLAQHLADRGCPAEITYLDLSATARRIAEARVEARGLTSIRFLTGPIADLPRLAPGEFDYIDCCGVLHHLDDPAAGLATLVSALAEDGGMGLMLYGAIGRTGVYHAQDMLRMLSADGEAPQDRLALALRLLHQLPATNWLIRNPAVADHIGVGEAGVYDLLLHARDRAFTVPEIVGLAARAGLEIVTFIEPWRYAPESYVSDGAVLKRIRTLDPLERAAFAELLAGNLKTHAFYVVRKGLAGTAVARPDGPAAVPIMRQGDGPALAGNLAPATALTVRIDGIVARFPLPRRARPMLMRIDGRRSLGAIHEDLARAERGRLDWEGFKAEFDQLYDMLNGLNRMFLAFPSEAALPVSRAEL